MNRLTDAWMLVGSVATVSYVDNMSGEVVIECGSLITTELAERLQCLIDADSVYIYDQDKH